MKVACLGGVFVELRPISVFEVCGHTLAVHKSVGEDVRPSSLFTVSDFRTGRSLFRGFGVVYISAMAVQYVQSMTEHYSDVVSSFPKVN